MLVQDHKNFKKHYFGGYLTFMAMLSTIIMYPPMFTRVNRVRISLICHTTMLLEYNMSYFKSQGTLFMV